MLNRTTTLTEFWNKFKGLPWWKKLLLFLPFILVAAVITVWAFADNSTPEDTAIDTYKKKVDENIKKYKQNSKKREKEIENLDKELDNIDKETKKINEDNKNLVDRIDNANANELVHIASELRTKYSRIGPKTPKTGTSPGEDVDS